MHPAATADRTTVGLRTRLPLASGPAALVAALAVVMVALLVGFTVLVLTGTGGAAA